MEELEAEDLKAEDLILKVAQHFNIDSSLVWCKDTYDFTGICAVRLTVDGKCWKELPYPREINWNQLINDITFLDDKTEREWFFYNYEKNMLYRHAEDDRKLTNPNFKNYAPPCYYEADKVKLIKEHEADKVELIKEHEAERELLIGKYKSKNTRVYICELVFIVTLVITAFIMHLITK